MSTSSNASGQVVVAGTFDTKQAELNFVAGCIREAGISLRTVDLSTGSPSKECDVSAAEVARYHPEGAKAVQSNDRGKAVGAMATAFQCYMQAEATSVAGVIGLGGSGGTALIAPAMRILPVGVPKVLVSTVASGNVAPYVGPSDISMVYSVTDVAGLNRISRRVLGNAAGSLIGMVRHAPQDDEAEADRLALALSMFGVTTPCITALTEALEADYECIVFHATGIGGRSMEKLVDSGLISGVLDITTTEVADLLVGGVFSAGEDRLDAIARTRVPYVGSCGALDMVNFGAMAEVPEIFRGRNLYEHNPQVTLMRTTVEENRTAGEWIGRKLNACKGPVRFLLPTGGVSMLDTPGQPFYDPEADAALFDALRATIEQTDERRLIDVPAGINDQAFVRATLESLNEIMKLGK